MLYARKPGASRPASPARLVFQVIEYVLHTACKWKVLPKERFGDASAVPRDY